MPSGPLHLAESHEWSGLWWLPDAPDDRVPGVLRYDRDGGVRLTLIGTFEDRIFSSPQPGVMLEHDGVRSWEVIHGVAEAREITLLGCNFTNSNRNLGPRVQSPDKQVVSAQSALIGVHATNGGDALFEALQLSIENLRRWSAVTVFSSSIGVLDGKRPDGSGSISAKPMESTSVLVDGTEYSLEHLRNPPYFDELRGRTTARMRDTVFLQVAPRGACSFEEALASMKSLQDLISLATHRAAGVIWLRLKLTGDGPGAERHPMERYVEVLYLPAAVGERDAKAIEHRRVFFTCRDIPFEEIVPRWCAVRDRLRASMDLILALRYAPAQYVESRLLMAVGAAEALHRALGIEKRPMPNAEFKKMREAMLELAPEDQRERLKSAIRNDLTLRDRLGALVNRPDQEAVSVLVPDVERWASRTVKARNDLAHEGRTPRHELEELVAVVEVTTGVVILNLLHEIGMPADRQRAIVREHPQLRMIASWARTELVTPEA
ncbi:HEPN domain-containing protein [Dermabacter hominis]|uniref:ApeA N-terminal domain 1-containing protein n=1 Tax=Dermabacter hominis TaxID=36740 RepID=UPI0007743510|nr:HEPN domain-containing protein [Dermabacter hominis]